MSKQQKEPDYSENTQWLEPAWQNIPPEELVEQDELRTEYYLEGSVGYQATDEEYLKDTDVELGTEQSLWGLNSTPQVRGHDGIALGYLLETGWQWGYEAFTPYTMKRETLDWLRPRLVKKINNRFYFRDLGIAPVGKWQRIFLTRLVEKLDELGPLYDQLKDGLDILDKGKDQEKIIDVYSDFPQARLLMEQEDYASNSRELAKESTGEKAQLDAMLQYQQQYTELDQQVIEHLESCFSSFVSTSLF